MRVLVDAHMVGSHETGNETYTANLLAKLQPELGTDLGAAVDASLQWPSFLDNTDITRLPLSSVNNWARLLYALPQLCHQWQADLLHVTYVAPFRQPCPTVVSVHDVSYKYYPQFFSPRDRLLFATLLPLSLRRASAVVTISDHAKSEIEATFPFLQGKVYSIPLAVGTRFRPKPPSTITSKYNITTDYILAVGNLQPRKNLPRLIHAYASILPNIGDTQLVIVGKAQWQSSEVYHLVTELGLENKVIFTGYVSDEDLILLYNEAELFVYPSLYEGFGLPILEAMACGTAVVCSNITSMPEVAGDSALLIDPYQDTEIATAMNRILTDGAVKAHLEQAGLERAAQFSWHKTALETMKVYERVVS